MAAWVRYTRQRFVYTGRATRAPFLRWAETAPGAGVVAEVASTIRFALLGARWAARRRLWRALAAAARDESVVRIVQEEVQRYFKHLGDLAYSDGLPREIVQYRRLVVVPTVLVNGNAYGAIDARLAPHHAFSGIDGGDALRQLFMVTVIDDLDGAARRTRPTPKAPIAAGPGWLAVGRNDAFDWKLPVMNEPAWAGHYYLLEIIREPVTRAVRKAVEAAVATLDQALPSLARLERHDILRRARRVA